MRYCDLNCEVRGFIKTYVFALIVSLIIIGGIVLLIR
jgi:hypothetical protein